MNRRIKTLTLLLLWALLLTAFGCSFASDPEDADSLDNEFYSFQILSSDNPGLVTSISGRLTDTKILLETTDTAAPDTLIPRFETGAVSVEVDGEAQTSGITAQDFTNTVSYILTDQAGNVRQYDAELMLGSGWFDIGVSPLQAVATEVFQLKAGVLNGFVPYVVSFEGAGDLKLHFYDSISDDWNEYANSQPVVSNDFDALSWDGSLWIVYENGGNIASVSPPTLHTDAWPGSNIFTATAGTWDLKLTKSSEDRFFAGWIEDPSGAMDIQVWKYDGVWSSLSAPDASYSFSDMELVAAGGDLLYMATLVDELPGVIHLCEYDGSDWSITADAFDSPYRDEGIVFKEMFYDTDEQTPVLFAAFPNDSGTYTLRALYWNLNGTTGTWSDYHPSGDGITPLVLSASQLDGLSLCWEDNSITAVAGNYVKHFSDGYWETLGSSFDSFEPGASAVAVLDGNYMVTYIDNPITDALYVKVKQ